MSAPKGNTNAVKYDPKVVAALINQYTDSMLAANDVPYLEMMKYHFEATPKYKNALPKGTYVWDYAKEHKIVSEAIQRLMNVQKLRILDGGLKGEYNASIVKFMGSVNHGMVEKTNTDITSDNKPIGLGLGALIGKVNGDNP